MNLFSLIAAILCWLIGGVQFFVNNPVAGVGAFISSGLFTIALAIYSKK